MFCSFVFWTHGAFTAQPRSAAYKLATHLLLYVTALVLLYMVGVGGSLARCVDEFVGGWVVGYVGKYAVECFRHCTCPSCCFC